MYILDPVRPSGPWCFPVRQGRIFVRTAAAPIDFFSRVPATSIAIRAISSSKRNGSSAAASSEPVASIEKRLASFLEEISEGTFRPRETYILNSVRPSGPWYFPVRQGCVFVGTAAAVAVASQ